MKPFLPAFSTNISFAQQLLNKQLLILHKMKIAEIIWRPLLQNLLRRKTIENYMNASGFGPLFLNALEMFSSESSEGWKWMFQPPHITIHSQFGKVST